MIIILSDSSDEVARAWCPMLGAAATVPVEIVTTAELVYSPSLTQRLGDGLDEASVDVVRFGRLTADRLHGVLNRIYTLPDQHLAAVAAADRAYMVQELQAVVASWLMALACPVVNRPSATYLAGPLLSQAAWENQAAASGFSVSERAVDLDAPEPVAPMPDRRAVVFDRRVFGAKIPHDVAVSCARLAHLTGCTLLEIGLIDGDAGLEFACANPCADLTVGGHAIARAIAAAFEAGTP